MAKERQDMIMTQSVGKRPRIYVIDVEKIRWASEGSATVMDVWALGMTLF